MENFEDIKTKYLELVDFLIKYCPKEASNLNNVKNECSDQYITDIVKGYVDGINKKKKYQTLLVDRNASMFHKEGHDFYIPFIKNFNLKKVLTKSDEYVRHIIWETLQIIYILVEGHKKEKWHTLLLYKIENTECPTVSSPPSDDKKNAIDNMVGDIASTFQNIMKDGNSENPFEAIMKTSMGIAQKYQGNFSEGQIDFKEIIKSMSKAFGQDENEVSDLIDNNPLLKSLMSLGGDNQNPEETLTKMGKELGIDTNGLVSGLDPESMLKDGKLNMGGIMGKLMSGSLGNLFGGDQNNNTEQLTDAQIKEMEDFFVNNSEEFEKYLSEKQNNLNIKNKE